MNPKLTLLIDQLKSLTLLEVAELVNEIEKVFGIDAVTPIVTAISSTTSAPVIEQKEEKVAFDILLTEVPADKKIAILKVIRNITGLGLKESKEIVDNVPKIVKEGLTKDEIENCKKELESAGAKVLVK